MASAGTEEQVVNELFKSLGIDGTVVVAQMISFIVLLLLLIKFLYKPIQSILQQRQEQIANSLTSAEAQQMQAEALRKEYEAHLANIADEARAKLDQAMKDAETGRQQMLEKTQADIRDLQTRFQAQLALEREQLRRELRAEMSDVAVLAATKALRTQLTPQLQSAVIDQVIAELDQPALPQA